MRLLLPLLLLASIGAAAYAQESSSAKSPAPMSDVNVVVVGDFFTGFKYTPSTATKPEVLTFTTTGVNPIFLWSIGDNLLVESEIEVQANAENQNFGYAAGEGLAVELEDANVGYHLGPGATVRAGIFFSSMGVFEDWYHQRITNRFVSRPLGIGHGGLESGTDLGVNLSGGIPLGSAKMNYSLDITTGPRLITDPNSEEGKQGQLIYEGIIDNNGNKNVGLKLGFLPLENSSLELGASVNRALVGDVNSRYSGVGATFLAGYLSWIQDLEALSGTVLFRSQYDQLKVDDATYNVPGDTSATPATYTFDNTSSAWYAQVSYRPTMVHSPILRKVEFGVRFNGIDYAHDSKWGVQETQLALVLDYWLEWNTVLKLSYEQDNISSKAGMATITQPPARVLLQMAMGF